jgi:hypothetical protein
MQNIPSFVSIVGILMNILKVGWDVNTCILIHKKCHLEIYHNDVKYHMTLNIIFNVVWDEVYVIM